MPEWRFLTNHTRVLVCIAKDPRIRLRDIAAAADLTERTTYGVVNDLVKGGYIVKERNGRRNSYRVEADHLVHDDAMRDRTLGEYIELLVGPQDRPHDLQEPPT